MWERYDRAALRQRSRKPAAARNAAQAFAGKHGYGQYVCKLHLFLRRLAGYEPELVGIVEAIMRAQETLRVGIEGWGEQPQPAAPRRRGTGGRGAPAPDAPQPRCFYRGAPTWRLGRGLVEDLLWEHFDRSALRGVVAAAKGDKSAASSTGRASWQQHARQKKQPTAVDLAQEWAETQGTLHLCKLHMLLRWLQAHVPASVRRIKATFMALCRFDLAAMAEACGTLLATQLDHHRLPDYLVVRNAGSPAVNGCHLPREELLDRRPTYYKVDTAREDGVDGAEFMDPDNCEAVVIRYHENDEGFFDISSGQCLRLDRHRQTFACAHACVRARVRACVNNAGCSRAALVRATRALASKTEKGAAERDSVLALACVCRIRAFLQEQLRGL